ncbi:AAA family ATPase [Eubacteriales bacterium OttesenSCG-928-M02]|nr:AAA family ATPase [Eubacteriales bacterium OttesenSCG-928-M02]
MMAAKDDRQQREDEYLASWGISSELLSENGIFVINGTLPFTYRDEDGYAENILYCKYGTPDNKRRRVVEDFVGRSKLYGMDKCQGSESVHIFMDEMEALSGMDAGIENCVSVPGLDRMDWLDTCWDFLERFERITIVSDGSEKGNAMADALTTRLDCYAIYRADLGGKSANAKLREDGKKALLDTVMAAKEVPAYGLLNAADIRPIDFSHVPKIKSGFSVLDMAIGGFLYGDLSIWTARTGEGKSTLLSQILVEALDDGHNVCAYSGELRADRFMHILNVQLAGESHLRQEKSYGRDEIVVPKDTLDAMRNWYRDRLYVYDNTVKEGGEENGILKAFDLAVRRYNCRVFLVDNLMTARFSGRGDDFLRQQSAFVGRLKEFATKYNVHVHLVAHPRKNTGAGLDSYDIAGTSDIPNYADNVFALEKIPEEDRGVKMCDATLKITKNRWDGAVKAIALNFNQADRRFYLPNVGNVRVYGWLPHQERFGETISGGSPFQEE